MVIAGSGCVSTDITTDRETGNFDAKWGGVGDTNRVWVDCRNGADKCLIYMEITQSEDIAPIIESLVEGVPPVIPALGQEGLR